MARHEFLALMLSIQALLDTDNVDKAKEVIEKIVENTSGKSKNHETDLS